MRYIQEILKKEKGWVAAYLTIGIGNAFLTNYRANCFQKIIDGLTNRTIALSGILFYGAVLCVWYGMNYLDNYPSAKLENEIYLDFKLLALRKISRIDYAEYQKLGTGKLIQRIENGADAGKGVLCDFWFCVLRELLPTILFSLYFIGRIDKKITGVLAAGYAVVFLVTNLLLKGLYQIKEKILANEEELNHYLVRGFMEMPVFRLKRQFPGEIKKAAAAGKTIVSAKVKMQMIHEAFFTMFAFLVACLDVGILVYAWQNSRLSVGSAVALLTLIDNAYTPVAIFNVLYVQYKLNKTAWRRFTSLLDLKEDSQLQQGTALDALSDGIYIRNLTFSYENRKVLDNVSLTVKKGEKVALVGESGSGKSTLAKILVGLLKYDEGTILFDDTPLKAVSLESLYEKTAYISQVTPVFDGTIRENLAFDKEASEEEIRTCLENAQLLPLLDASEKGIETKIGEKGACLSGGEKQRLALARLWFDHPEIIVLDEAASALDNVTESLVMQNVLKQAAQATIVAVAHRLASIRGFDRVVVFRGGKIVGNGTFEELLTDNPYFGELCQKEKDRA